jgi:hypothetical protein
MATPCTFPCCGEPAFGLFSGGEVNDETPTACQTSGARQRQPLLRVALGRVILRDLLDVDLLPLTTLAGAGCTGG